jgi:hypothetical protein
LCEHPLELLFVISYLRRFLAASIAAVAVPALCLARQEPGVSPPVAEARAGTEAPMVDGDVLGDPVWQQSRFFTGFCRRRPTKVNLRRNAPRSASCTRPTRLYFGVVCYDSDPTTIIVNESRRDSQLDDTDSFRIILDTYGLPA